MICLDILFIWQLNEVVASKRFGRLCLRIEPRPQNENAGCTFCRNLMSAPQPLKVGTTPLIFNIKKGQNNEKCDI